MQSDLKQKGWPWEISKAFDQSAPLGTLTAFDEALPLDNIAFECSVNGDVRQTGNTGEMMFSIPTLINYLSGIWELKEGDLIYTGPQANKFWELNRFYRMTVNPKVHPLRWFDWMALLEEEK